MHDDPDILILWTWRGINEIKVRPDTVDTPAIQKIRFLE